SRIGGVGPTILCIARTEGFVRGCVYLVLSFGRTSSMHSPIPQRGRTRLRRAAWFHGGLRAALSMRAMALLCCVVCAFGVAPPIAGAESRSAVSADVRIP